MTRIVRLKLPSTVAELWRVWTAMLDIVASGADVMATGRAAYSSKLARNQSTCAVCAAANGTGDAVLS